MQNEIMNISFASPDSYKKEKIKKNPFPDIESIYNNALIKKSLTEIEDYDLNTYKHSLEVGQIARYIIENIGSGLTENEGKSLAISSQLHDSGKTDVNKIILNKQGKLSKKDFEEIKVHPEKSKEKILDLGESIISDLSDEEEIEEIRNIINAAAISTVNHHEFQANPYPVAKNIELDKGTKLLTAIDCFASMTEEYRPSNHGVVKKLEEIGQELYNKYAWTKDRAFILEAIMLMEEYYIKKMQRENKTINYNKGATIENA